VAGMVDDAVTLSPQCGGTAAERQKPCQKNQGLCMGIWCSSPRAGGRGPQSNCMANRAHLSFRAEVGLAPGSVQIFFGRLHGRPVSRAPAHTAAGEHWSPAWPRRSLRPAARCGMSSGSLGTLCCPRYRGLSRAVAMTSARPLRCCDTVQFCASYGGIAGQRARCRTYSLAAESEVEHLLI
jgi:hypothetical protein